MKLRRKVAAIVLIAMMTVCGETGRAIAQSAGNEAPPDLRMLMNLDLFEPRHNGAKSAPAPAASPSDDSMLDQIQTLNQMGYLASPGDNGNTTPAPRAPVAGAQGAEDVAPPAQPQPMPAMPASQPSYDAEGPQP